MQEKNRVFITKNEALELLRRGEIVQGYNGMYLRHVEHGGRYIYKMQDSAILILDGLEWRSSRGSFDLHSQFFIYQGDPLPVQIAGHTGKCPYGDACQPGIVAFPCECLRIWPRDESQ